MEPIIAGKKPSETKVVVAMSGGVDSSVVAAMLKEQGYQVIGMTMQLYDHGQAINKKGACCAGQDIADAKRVAEAIDIPHYVLNYESLFRQSVINDFVDSYLHGETPIPCVKCNQKVKFRDLLGMAKDLGADALATGHYVQRFADADNADEAELRKGLDKSRDQSYFLFTTTKEQLDFLRFPLGGMTKTETRELAKKYSLEVSEKPDSQDICFVPEGKYIGVIEKLRPGALDSGEIVHIDGRVLGSHNGIINYTIGQRRGLGIASAEPLYVVSLDPETKRVVVGEKEFLAKTSIKLKEVNWLINAKVNESIECEVKIRSTQDAVPATVNVGEDGAVEVMFKHPEYGVSPGQACVFYEGERVLGGGWIDRS